MMYRLLVSVARKKGEGKDAMGTRHLLRSAMISPERGSAGMRDFFVAAGLGGRSKPEESLCICDKKVLAFSHINHPEKYFACSEHHPVRLRPTARIMAKGIPPPLIFAQLVGTAMREDQYNTTPLKRIIPSSTGYLLVHL